VTSSRTDRQTDSKKSETFQICQGKLVKWLQLASEVGNAKCINVDVTFFSISLTKFINIGNDRLEFLTFIKKIKKCALGNFTDISVTFSIYNN